jgi:iron complex outermembrane receptor protein
VLRLFRRPLPEVVAERIMAPIGASTDWSWHGYDTSWVEVAGQRMQNAPEWTASAGFTYTFPMASNLTGTIGSNYTYTGEKFLTSILQTARSTIRPQHIVNANFDVNVAERYTVGVFATNLLDSRYVNSVFDAPGTLGLTNYAPPRMFGVSLKVDY